MLMMTDRDNFDEADDEASLVDGVLSGVSMLLMLNKKNVDEASDADLI